MQNVVSEPLSKNAYVSIASSLPFAFTFTGTTARPIVVVKSCNERSGHSVLLTLTFDFFVSTGIVCASSDSGFVGTLASVSRSSFD